MSITILKFTPYEKGNFRGFVDIAVPAWNSHLEIRGCRLMQGQYGLFVTLPQREYEVDGETRWHAILELQDKDLQKNLIKAINVAFKEYREKNELASSPPAPPENIPINNDGPSTGQYQVQQEYLDGVPF